MTIAGLMVITAFVAVEHWFLRVSNVQKVSLHLVLAMVVCYIVLVVPEKLRRRKAARMLRELGLDGLERDERHFDRAPLSP
jgi:hypothetical protein